MDTTTAFARLLVGALGGGHPIRLLVGVSFSFIAKTLIFMFAQMNPETIFWSALNQLSVLDRRDGYAVTVHSRDLAPLWCAGSCHTPGEHRSHTPRGSRHKGCSTADVLARLH
jgi:hypothetical protein